MRFVKTIFMILAVIFILPDFILANTIRVPSDERTLREGLRAARNGDTVLVADGVWTGDDNIGLSFSSSGVTLISENGADDCIIDGGGADESYGLNLDGSCVVRGFTFRRFKSYALKSSNERSWEVSFCNIERNEIDSSGYSAFWITGSQSNGDIICCNFVRNTADSSGGALFVKNGDVHVESCRFTSNSTGVDGGAIYASNGADVFLRNCIIEQNSSFFNGGGIALKSPSTDLEMSFCNLLNNHANNWGGGLFKDGSSRPVILNSIIWGNDCDGNFGQQMAGANGADNRMISINYCIVEGGEDHEAGWFGDDLITVRPIFVRGERPIWGPTNSYIRQDSEAIDAGSESVEEAEMEAFTTHPELEPDEGTVDIGFHYDLRLYYTYGTLTGHTYDADGNVPLERVRVTTSIGQSNVSVQEGFWIIGSAIADTIFDVTASCFGYLDTTVTGIELLEGREVVLDFTLLHAEFEIDPRNVNSQVILGDTGFVDLTITNGGNGVLEWDSSLELVGDVNVDPWTLRDQIAVQELTGDEHIKGAAFAEGFYWITGRSGLRNDSHLVYKISLEGELVDSFYQFGSSRQGMNDLAWDGELLWGTEDDSIFGFSLEGVLDTVIRGPLNVSKNIAYDPIRDVLWVGYINGDIHAIRRNGERPYEDGLNSRRLRMYGLAFWEDDPDDCGLYLLTRLDDVNHIYKMNPDDPDTVYVSSFLPIGDGRTVGGFVTSDMDPYSVNIMFLTDDNDRGDRVDVFMLAGNTTWMMMEPREGIIGPESNEILNIALFDPGFSPGEYSGLLTITHNAVDGIIEIPILLDVRAESAPYENPVTPLTPSIESTFPNPFNAELTVTFSIPSAGPVSLKAFDLAGREVADLANRDFAAGRYAISVDARDWSTGIYLLELRVGNEVRVAKLACIK